MKQNIIKLSYVILVAITFAFSEKQNAADMFNVIIEPRYDTLHIPSNEIVLLDEEAGCHNDINEWDSIKLEGSELIVKYHFHSGAGRYWTIGISNSDSSGLYVNTTTIGYRNLKQYIDGALPWKYDFNKDGIDEFILWDSFLAFESQTNGDFGLIAWVYEINKNNLLIFNKKYTCKIWDKIIQSHFLDSADTDNILEKLSIEKKHKIADMIKLKKMQYESEY